MNFHEYFGDWLKVFDIIEFNKIIYQLNNLYKYKNMCPSLYKDVFKAFNICDYNNCKIMFISEGPYSQQDMATGLCFANKQEVKEDNYSAVLKVIKDACIDLHYSNNSIIFDPTLEDWGRQGILLLNSALTTEVNKTGFHTMMWRPFISSFLKNFSDINPGIIYVLFGKAKTLEPYIKNGIILRERHPSYYIKNNIEMPSTLFYNINILMRNKYKEEIKWFKQFKYE